MLGAELPDGVAQRELVVGQGGVQAQGVVPVEGGRFLGAHRSQPATSRTSTSHGQAAADADHLSGDERRGVRREEQHGRGDLLRPRQAAKRDGFDQRLFQPLGLGVEQRRVGRARAHAVDRDLVPGHLPGQRLGQRDHPALGARVDGFPGAADAARVAGQVDDAPAGVGLDHPRQERGADVHRPQVVDRHHLGREFRCGVEELIGAIPAGGVHHDVGHADFGVGRIPQGVDLGRVGDIHRQRGDQLGALLGRGHRGGLVQVGGDHPVALCGERQRYRLADTRTGAGHDGQAAC